MILTVISISHQHYTILYYSIWAQAGPRTTGDRAGPRTTGPGPGPGPPGKLHVYGSRVCARASCTAHAAVYHIAYKAKPGSHIACP